MSAICSGTSGPVEEGEQQRGEGDAERAVAAQQRDRDAEEAEPGGEVGRCSEWVSPSRSGRPIRPATAPESSIVLMTMPRASTPLAVAADGDSPVARRSKPNRVRLSRTAMSDADDDGDDQEAVELPAAARPGPSAVEDPVEAGEPAGLGDLGGA